MKQAVHMLQRPHRYTPYHHDCLLLSQHHCQSKGKDCEAEVVDFGVTVLSTESYLAIDDS